MNIIPPFKFTIFFIRGFHVYALSIVILKGGAIKVIK
jgi:hypothetical protein